MQAVGVTRSAAAYIHPQVELGLLAPAVSRPAVPTPPCSILPAPLPPAPPAAQPVGNPNVSARGTCDDSKLLCYLTAGTRIALAKRF
jgi:hypothetical protein